LTAPRISAFANGDITPLQPVFPAVTCSVQSSMLTGLPPTDHGIVGNGWYNRDSAEVRFWQRSDALVQGEKIWETAKKRDPRFTCANLFWWHNTYASCDTVLQARPIYKADGRKIPDCYCNQPTLRDSLQNQLGRFPLFRFWGPMADITSSRWIAQAAKHITDQHHPTLCLVYLPHLDYSLQKLGPNHPDIPKHVAEIDNVVGDLIDCYQSHQVKPLVLSEYGIEPTLQQGGAIAVNRELRRAGLLALREEGGLEQLDPGACRAFAVTDHQVAHVYHEPNLTLPKIPGGSAVHLEHPRAGNTVLVADPGRWFTYDHWFNDRKAPDFARTVDIHRKPGYDPRELFSSASPMSIAWKLAKKKLGFRQLMDIIPLDTNLVRGTHGRTDMPADLHPLLIGANAGESPLPCTAVRDVLLDCLFEK